MTTPDIYTVEARRRLAEAWTAAGYNSSAHSYRANDMFIDVPAQALAATLRELNWQPPVDPDLEEARKVVADINSASPAYAKFAAEVLEGKWGGHTEVKVALAAIKRGRELERGA